MLLQAMQQFTGMNIIMYYAPRIFKMAGFTTTEQQMIATLGGGPDLYVCHLYCGVHSG